MVEWGRMESWRSSVCCGRQGVSASGRRRREGTAELVSHTTRLALPLYSTNYYLSIAGRGGDGRQMEAGLSCSWRRGTSAAVLRVWEDAGHEQAARNSQLNSRKASRVDVHPIALPLL